MYNVKQGSILTHVCQWKIGSRWQTWILLYLCACAANKWQSVHSGNIVQQGEVGKFIRRKGGADENHQKLVGLVQDHVPGQVIEVVEILVALASCL